MKQVNFHYALPTAYYLSLCRGMKRQKKANQGSTFFLAGGLLCHIGCSKISRSKEIQQNDELSQLKNVSRNNIVISIRSRRSTRGLCAHCLHLFHSEHPFESRFNRQTDRQTDRPSWDARCSRHDSTPAARHGGPTTTI